MKPDNQNFYAIILAAGLGTRLRPLTLTQPKALVEVGGKALIDWHLHRLAKAGISDVAINLHWLADKVQGHIGSGASYGLNCHWSFEPELLDSAGGVRNCMQQIPQAEERPFVLISADIWTDWSEFSDTSLKNFANSECSLGHLHLAQPPTWMRHGKTPADFAIVDNQLTSGKGQWITPQDNARLAHLYVYSGLSLWKPEAFASIPANTPASLWSDIIEPRLSNTGENSNRLTWEILPANWCDPGTPDDLAQLKQLLLR